MSKRHAVRLTLACVALALAAGVSASRATRRAAAAQGAQTFDVTHYGAVGDGMTDDGPAFQAALNALADAGGGTLFVPAGRYAIVTPVARNFGGLTAPIKITGVPSTTEPAPPTAGGDELTRGLNLTSELLPRTGSGASTLSLMGAQNVSVEELAFVGTPGVAEDTLVSVYFADVGEAAVRHCEFYGLASLNGAVVMAVRSSLKVERSVVLGCTTSSGTYSSIIQNTEWKGVSVTDSIFADYGQRPELFGKMNLAAPFAWVNLGNAAAVTGESPRREAVFRRVFFDEGGMSAIASTPERYPQPSPPIDLIYVSMLRMNVSNLHTSGLHLKDLRGALVEDGRFGWSHNAYAAVNLLNGGSAILSRIECADSVRRVLADAATPRLVAIDAACPEIVSQAPVTRVFTAATPDDDPTRYVRARFQAVLAREPDPAAHFYWADRILRCGTDAACVTNARAALASYLATNPQPTFNLEGRATDEAGAPVAGVAVTLSGSQSVSTLTGADGRYRFRGLPTSGAYTVAAAKRHYTFANSQRSVVTPAGAQTVDFAATVNRFKIVGRLVDAAGRVIAGATVTLSGTQSAAATTDALGEFGFVNLAGGGNYTVTPSSPRYSFAPASQSVTDLSELTVLPPFNATPLFHSIGGQLVGPGGSALGGVGVALGGSKTATTTTNPQGFFLFTDVPRGGNYTVTPGPAVGFTFSPASKSFTNLTSDQDDVYTGTPTNFRVSGRATLGGAALSGVTVNVTGSRTATATTDANGAYSFALPVNGNYTVTPARQHHTFAPASTTFNALSADRTADFAATLNRHRITGRVARSNGQAMSGVTVALSGSQTATATTDANGDYSFTNLPAGGNYTVTPSKLGYDFSPASRAFSNLGADQSAPFVVAPSSFTVGGRVASGAAGLSGVTVTLSGARSATATTDANGNYSFTVSSEGNYTVTPAKQHYTFAPPSQSFTNPTSNKTADFAATINRHKITGRVARSNGQAMSGVTVALSGGQTATATTDANGNYSFTNLPAGGDYTVTPARAGYVFAPGSRSVVGLGADQTADFTVTPDNFAIAGRVTTGGAALSGVTVTLSGSRSATATTDADGAYSFTVSSEGTYTVTPSKTHYTFAPPSRSFTNPVTNSTADFAATLNRHNISGRVTRAGGVGVPGVTVTLSGGQSATATTDSNGNYTLAGVAAGGNYAVSAAKANYTVTPPTATFTNLSSDRTADFTASPLNLTVGGRVTTAGGVGVSGVVLALTGSQAASATTDANGAYSFSVPADGDYTVTPSKRHYTFSPTSLSFKALDGNKAADFAATVNRHAIRGRVTDFNNNGISGVAVALSGSQTATTTTDPNGQFSFSDVAAGGSYTVTPAQVALTFSPASQTFSDLGADAFVGFVGTLAHYRVSGRVTERGAPLAGVGIELAGSHPALGPVGARLTTGDDGSYSFDVLAGGDYAVVPSKKNYGFDPAAASFKGLTSDHTADFAATPLPTFEFGAADYSVAEDGGSVTVTVTRVGDATHGATVVYKALGDTARGGADFIASIGQLTFAPGETSKTFSVFITDDAFVEGGEQFTLTLTAGEGTADGAAPATHVTITDNDFATAAPNPVDEDEFFVRQHYRDFFGREPDAEGLAFWVGEIKKCGAVAACREARRVSVSAAFFLSIEFQETGFLVYRLYRAAYGRAPSRVEEFMLDASVMGEGVVVGRAGWEQRLAANKAASIRAFVERAQFSALYPTSMTPAQFVDALFLSAGVSPSASERQAAVDDFGGEATSADPEARAFALRRVAEHPALNRQELNRAFVLMQYFGYLRRNPNETPDKDFTGYDHWLGKLNEFGGDYERAEMVKAFLDSSEYRGRFGN